MVGKQRTISTSHFAAGRAVDQLRRQLGIVIQERNGELMGACPMEGLTEEVLLSLRALPESRMEALLTGARAKSLCLDPKEAKTVRVNAQDLPLSALQALADPLVETQPLPDSAFLPGSPTHDMLIALAKHAALLPALLTVKSAVLPQDWVRVALEDITAYWSAPPLDMVPLARAALPIEAAEDVTAVCFRERHGTSVHLALTIGDIGEKAVPLVRVHSSCVTGDLLGSLRCDCGDQLRLALAEIAKAGGGILLYLHQEGRGIGIANKLRAYALQERGIDTYEANRMLGFDEDERDFAVAAAILKKQGITRMRLLTNNPHKVENLEKHGIAVAERVPLVVPAGRHNHAYLSAKAKRHVF